MQILLSCAHPMPRTFQFPVFCQWGGSQEPVREHGQDSCPKLAKGIFHPKERHAWCINWGELAGSCQSLLRDGLGIGQGVGRNWIEHHLFPLGLISLPLFIVSLLIITIIYCCFYSFHITFISVIKLFSTHRFYLFLIHLYVGGAVREQLHST